MKLDLLYEFQPKIKPWSKPHPYGQREAEQRTYDEAVAEIQYADALGFNTVWVVEHHFRDGRSASPCSEAILGGLALSTNQIKLGFGVTLMPFGSDVKSVRTALRVFEEVAACQPVGLSELSRRLGVPKASVQRAHVANHLRASLPLRK